MGAAGVGGSSARGEITSLTELGPRTADGSRDIVEVHFAGVLEDGTTIDADVVCELQNAF
jgi:FKBP-type peptidyl-prolyl cis-trans isomerase